MINFLLMIKNFLKKQKIMNQAHQVILKPQQHLNIIKILKNYPW